MRVRFMIVPPDGGEIDHVMFADVPELPRDGDYILVSSKGGKPASQASYLVRRVWWSFRDRNDDDGTIEIGDEIGIEVEEIIGQYADEDEKARMKQAGHKEIEATAY